MRAPLLLLPFSLSGLASAVVSFNRLSGFLNAEELERPYLINPAQELAVEVEGDFEWENVPKLDEGLKAKDDTSSRSQKQGEDKKDKAKEEETQQQLKQSKSRWWKRGKDAPEPPSPLPLTTNPEKSTIPPAEMSGEKEKPFGLTGLHLRIPRGSFVAIVGRVGSGKAGTKLSLRSIL